AIRWGVSGWGPAAGGFRHPRLGRSRKEAPSTIFSHEPESDDVLLVDALLWSEMEYTTATRTLSATTYPTRKSGPLTRARLENRIRITEMMAAGLIATPTANVKTSLIPDPIASPSPRGEGGLKRGRPRPGPAGPPASQVLQGFGGGVGGRPPPRRSAR